MGTPYPFQGPDEIPSPPTFPLHSEIRTPVSRISKALLISGLVFCAGLSIRAQSLEAYIDFSAENLPGRLYVPPDGLDPDALRPLVIALHGGGAIGSDNIGNIWDFESLLNAARSHGAFIYAPQATSAFWHAQDRPAAIMDQVDQAIGRYGIDPNRITVTGFSMGGGGAWHLGSMYPDRVAAVLPVCGIAPGSGYNISALADKPVWAFHARNDPVVAVSHSHRRIDELLGNGGLAALNPPASDAEGDFEFKGETLPINYTEWESGGHAIWNRVYTMTDATDWLFSQSLSDPEPVGKITRHPQSFTKVAGSSLQLSVATADLEHPSYQWTRDGQPLAGANTASLFIADLQPSDAGLYRVEVSREELRLISRPALVRVAEYQSSSLTNLSVRANLAENAAPLIAGFVTAGDYGERMFRAIGPSLRDHGVSDPLPDPQIELHQNVGGQDTVLAENSHWEGAPRIREFTTAVGAFPLPNDTSQDAALLWNGTGAFTAHITDSNQRSGTVLVELYAGSPIPDQPMINISARQHLPSPDDVLIAGFVLNGNTPRQVLVRAVGPALARAGVSEPMTNPTLSLFWHRSSEDILFAQNTHWSDESNASLIPGAVPGAFALLEGEADAALLLTLPSGVYTIHASSADHNAGDVLIEVYLVPESLPPTT